MLAISLFYLGKNGEKHAVNRKYKPKLRTQCAAVIEFQKYNRTQRRNHLKFVHYK